MVRGDCLRQSEGVEKREEIDGGEEMTKLIKCKACGNEISRTAKSCPHCGELSTASKITKMGTGFMGIGCALILIPIAIVVILFLIGVFQQ